MRREYERQKSAVAEQYDHDKELLKGKVENVKNEVCYFFHFSLFGLIKFVSFQTKGWYNWLFPSTPNSADKAKAEAESAVKRASSSVSDAANRTSSTLTDATNRASNAISSTTNQASDYIDRQASAAGKSVRENISAAEKLAREKSDDLENYAKKQLDSTRGFVQESKEEVRQSGRSWFSWGGEKVDQGKEKVEEAKDNLDRRASGVKESLKDGLLAVEKKVEEGSQKAQEKTKKMQIVYSSALSGRLTFFV